NNPNFWASWAVISSPVNKISFALLGPTKGTSFVKPDHPGALPIFVSGKPILVLLVESLISQDKASSNPPPKTQPSKILITGTRSVAKELNTAAPYLEAL